ncbi:hypothetical protein BV898_12641 [Hypsibius exemplaris]|uniref:Uncharacterized protein n=1 Tax=Hypsibius exemplaris TaxID=2072580 RepID=A0A1W0WD33_HYPEX|nr:hypothetical protein BV898_12641 [Hypsibius exemplaris]
MVAHLLLVSGLVLWLTGSRGTDSASVSQDDASVIRPCHLFTDGTYRCLSGCRRVPRDPDTGILPDMQLARAVDGGISDPALGLICTEEHSVGVWAQKNSNRLSGNRSKAKDYFSTCMFDHPSATFECASGPSCKISGLGRVVCKSGPRIKGLFTGGSNDMDPIRLDSEILPQKEEPTTTTTPAYYK